MILEAALLSIKPGRADHFEEAMRQARPLIKASAGFGGIEVRRCIERPDAYLLLGGGKRWRTTPSDFAGRIATSNGGRCCTISTTRSPPLSISSRPSCPDGKNLMAQPPSGVSS
ncbi:MAG: antibiotic biosynthesis monooxygenase [Sphingomonadales bacterium]